MAARKLIHRMIVLAIVPVILSMIIFGSLSYSIFKEKLIQERIEEAESLIGLASEEITNPLYFLELNKLNNIVQNIKKNPNVLSVYIMDSSGRVITDGTPENKFYNQILNDNLSKKSVQSNELLYEIKNDVLQVSAPAVINEKIGILRIDFSLKELDQALINLFTLLVIVGVIIFIGAVAMNIIISGSISKPIIMLGSAAGEISKGNFDTRIEIKSDDEIGELATAFNKMSQDLKKSNDEIISAKEYTDNIVRSMTDTLIVVSQDCIIQTVNPATCGLLGYSEKELIGQPIGKVLADEKKSQFSGSICSGLIKKGFIGNVERIYLSKDSREIPVVFSASIMRDNDGKVQGIVCVAKDITERKQAEKEKDRLFKAIDSSTEGITIANEKDQYIYVNAAYAMIFGYSQEELIGKTWRKIAPSELVAQIEKGLAGTMHNRDVGEFHGEVPGLRKDGTIIPTDVRGTALWDGKGSYQGHICIVRDVTERKRAEEELKIKAQLLDTATDSIFVHDLDGNFIYLNEAAYKSRGYTKDELMMMNLQNIVTPEYGDLIKPHTKELTEKGEVVFESADISKNKSVIPVEVHASIIESGGKKLVLSVARDITERKKAEELLKERARAELYGFIVSALPVFASGVPSQVRNTLVKNFAERFEKNIRPRFEEEMKCLGYARKARSDNIENTQEVLDVYMSWLRRLFSNFGIQSGTTSDGTRKTIEFLNCPWIGEARGNPIFCFICRTVVIRSFIWTNLKGSADQSSSIADGSQTCRFDLMLMQK